MFTSTCTTLMSLLSLLLSSISSKTHLPGLAVNDSNMVGILLQPAVDIRAETADNVKWRWVMVVKWKVLNTSVKFRLVICTFWTSTITVRAQHVCRGFTNYAVPEQQTTRMVDTSFMNRWQTCQLWWKGIFCSKLQRMFMDVQKLQIYHSAIVCITCDC